MKRMAILAALLLSAPAQATSHMDVAVWAAKNGYRLVPDADVVEMTYDLPNNGSPVKWMEIQARWMVEWPEFDPAWADNAGIEGRLEVWVRGAMPIFSVRSVGADSTTVGPWTFWKVGRR